MFLESHPEGERVASLTAQQLRRRYSMALSLIALLTVLSQAGIQLLIADQRHDSRVVNIAGRQRMLSQKITKTCLYLAKAESAKASTSLRQQLEEALHLWVRSHQGLLHGDAELGLPGRNSTEVGRLFNIIEPHHLAMVTAVRAILAAPEDSALLSDQIRRIRIHESLFLKGMNEIVFRYDWEANEKVAFASRLEWGLMAVTLLVLALEAIFIFAPATRRIQLDIKELAEREEDLKRLFAVSPTALLLVDREKLEILGLNRKALEFMGTSLESFTPGPLSVYLDAMHDRNRDFLDRIEWGAEINGMEVAFSGSGGTLLDTLASVRGLHFLGRSLLVVGLTDITAIRQAEREQQAMESRLNQAQRLESLGRLAAGIAHEINTPAQYVGFNIQFLRESFADIDRCLALLRRLPAIEGRGAPLESRLAEARRLSSVIDLDYLLVEIPKAIAQSQEGMDRISTIVQAMNIFSHPGGASKVQTDINQAILATLEISRNEWKFCAEMSLDLAPDLPRVPAFPAEINQAILNLIINAAHAIDEKMGDGVKGLIGISTHAEGNEVVIRINDNGCGIPDAIKAKIFDPFFTTKRVGKGTGQGLPLAYATIVEKHGGTLEIASDERAGTTALIRLPLTEPR